MGSPETLVLRPARLTAVTVAKYWTLSFMVRTGYLIL
jgi:hypothetical protein